MVALISLVVSVLALAVAFGGVWYLRNQVNVMREQVVVMREQVNLSRDEKNQTSEWATKHDRARRLVLQTNNSSAFQTGVTWGYPLVFADSTLRSQIETYIVELDTKGIKPRMTPRDLDEAKFLSPVVQEVIQQTLDTVEEFKRRCPQESARLGL